MPLAYYAGQILPAAALDAIVGMLPRVFVKAADQLYSGTTTFQNDVELTCSLEANSVYEVLVTMALSGTDGDIKTTWSVPDGATGLKMCLGPALASTDRTDTTMRSAAHNLTTNTVTYGVNHATNYAGALEHGLVTTVSAGTLTIQHTQSTSTANPSGLAASSRMTVRKIS